MSGEPSSALPTQSDESFSASVDTGFPAHSQTQGASQGISQSQSQNHSFQSFGQYSQFLRSAVADEESLQVGESLQALAVQIEAMVTLLQQGGHDRRALALALFNLVGDLRAHRAQLLALGDDWHRFYEFDAHFSSLNHFRILVTQWAMEAAPPRLGVPLLADFDLAAWRVLGAGSLLLDVYEQSRKAVVPQDELSTEPSVWGRWSAWWTRRQMRRKVVRQEGRRGRRKTD